MQEFTNWTIKTIREDKFIGSWLEERKYDWIPLVNKTINNIINKQKSILILTDEKHNWFKEYILSNINRYNGPMLPFYDFNIFVKNNKIKNQEDMELVKDLLDLTFIDGYIIWYIGRGRDKNADIAKMSNNTFLWIFGEDIQNSFVLDEKDGDEFRLLQMFRLFQKTIYAVIFAEIEINR